MKLKKDTYGNLWSELNKSETIGKNFWVVIYNTPKKLTQFEKMIGVEPQKPGTYVPQKRKIDTITGSVYQDAPYIFKIVSQEEYDHLWSKAKEGSFPEYILGDL